MKEQIISKYMTAKLIKRYYNYHFCDLASVKVRPRVDDNDIYMYVRLTSVINRKKIVEDIVLDEAEIINKLCDYMESNYCQVQRILHEPYSHNMNIKYDGNFIFEERRQIKPLMKRRRV